MPRTSTRKKKKASAIDEEIISDNNDEESISGPDAAAAEDDEDESSEEDEILAAAMAAKMAAPAGGASPASSRRKTPAKKKAKSPTKAKAKAAKASPKTPPKSAKGPNNTTSPRRGSTGAKRTKPKGESQKEAQARCLEARTASLAMLAPLDLDGREEALHDQGRRTLRDPQDDEYISPLNCLVRSQIEIFQATEDHPKASFVQQIGLRCVNCATACEADPNARAAAGAEKFPQCKDNIGSAIRNWHRTHIVHCQYRPEEIVPIYDALRSMQVRAGNKGINYYQLANDRLDLIDVSLGTINGVALKPKSTQVMAQSSGMNLSRNKGSGRKSGSGGSGAGSSPNRTPQKGTAASASESAKKRKKLGKEPKASIAAILDGTIASPVAVRSNPDRPLKKVYESDEYVSDPEGGDDSSSEEEIEVTSDEEEESSGDEEEEEMSDLKPKAKGKKKAGGTPDEYKEVEALDLQTMERVGLYRATADAAAQLGIVSSNILKACRDGGGYVEQYFIRFANEDGAAHAAEVESVYQPTEEDVQKYIERARKTCAESAAKKRDEDDEEAAAASPMPSDDGRGDTAEERYGDKVDNLVQQVMESQGNEADDSTKDEVAEARQQLIRHQLLQRMKMADKAGVSPEQFCKRYMAQLRVNDERESKKLINKKKAKSASSSTKKKKKKKKPATKSTKPKEASKSSRPTATSRTIGTVRKAAEEALKKRKHSDDDAPKPAKKKPKKGAQIVGHWSEAEDTLLLEAMCKFGHDWSSCSEYVGTRTHIQCKSRHQKMEIKGLIQYDY